MIDARVPGTHLFELPIIVTHQSHIDRVEALSIQLALLAPCVQSVSPCTLEKPVITANPQALPT